MSKYNQGILVFIIGMFALELYKKNKKLSEIESKQSCLKEDYESTK